MPVLTGRHRADDEPGDGGGRQVLERVDSDVDGAREQRLAQGRGEDPGAAGGDERAGGDVAFGLDDAQLDLCLLYPSRCV